MVSTVTSRLFLGGVALLTVATSCWDYLSLQFAASLRGGGGNTEHRTTTTTTANCERDAALLDLVARLNRLEEHLQSQQPHCSIPDELYNIRSAASEELASAAAANNALVATTSDKIVEEATAVEEEETTVGSSTARRDSEIDIDNKCQCNCETASGASEEVTPTVPVETSPPQKMKEVEAVPPQEMKDVEAGSSSKAVVDEREEEEDDAFDPTMKVEDYLSLKHHSPPSEEWLQTCDKLLSRNANIKRKFRNHPDTPWGYPLGDCIKQCKKCDQVRNRPFNLPWNATMAGAYQKMACPKNEDFEKIDEIFTMFEDREGFEKPPPDALVIHLRLGDVVENTLKSASELLIHGGIGGHPETMKRNISSIHSLYEYLDIIQVENATHVILIGGSHFPTYYKVSKVYAHCLQRGLAKATGIQVDMHIEGRHPDHDFYFMSHAKRLMVSTGGFSRMMGRMAVRNGGKLVGPDLLWEKEHKKSLRIFGHGHQPQQSQQQQQQETNALRSVSLATAFGK